MVAVRSQMSEPGTVECAQRGADRGLLVPQRLAAWVHARDLGYFGGRVFQIPPGGGAKRPGPPVRRRWVPAPGTEPSGRARADGHRPAAHIAPDAPTAPWQPPRP